MGVGRGLRKLLLALYGFIGVVALIAGLVWTVHSARVAGGWVAVEGVVVDLEEDYSMFLRGLDRLSPQIEYPSPEGVPLRFWAAERGDEDLPFLGERVDLLYAPDDPNQVIVASFRGLWAGPIVLLGSAVLMIGAVVATGLLFRRHPARPGGGGGRKA
ncbi:MAG: DUF3592 domain-containing protein [Acidimicrobiia bacterium]